jgi:hypothetical protein
MQIEKEQQVKAIAYFFIELYLIIENVNLRLHQSQLTFPCNQISSSSNSWINNSSIQPMLNLTISLANG